MCTPFFNHTINNNFSLSLFSCFCLMPLSAIAATAAILDGQFDCDPT